jgi:hypothetical protein
VRVSHTENTTAPDFKVNASVDVARLEALRDLLAASARAEQYLTHKPEGRALREARLRLIEVFPLLRERYRNTKAPRHDTMTTDIDRSD